MIKLQYKPMQPDKTWGYAQDIPSVEELTMTLGDDVTWDEATREFHNFLRAAGFVIPYDIEWYEDGKDVDDDDPLQKLTEWEENYRPEELETYLTKNETQEVIQALEEAVYLLSPTDEDMQKKAGVYRVVRALEKLKERNTP